MSVLTVLSDCDCFKVWQVQALASNKIKYDNFFKLIKIVEKEEQKVDEK